MKVLITAGGTEEKIDHVRSITNSSTGNTGLAIAEHFAENGASVDLLLNSAGIASHRSISTFAFTSFEDLESLIHERLNITRYDFIIHSAAVSDFKCSGISMDKVNFYEADKITSSSDVYLKLTPRKKIINSLKRLQPNSTLIGFKFTASNSEDENSRAIGKLFKNSNCDFVVHNSALTKKSAHEHPIEIYDRDFNIVAKTNGTKNIASKIFDLTKVAKL
ncbi:MAG: phosphopantothenoylcysteine decarboxylase [Bdellovibrionales bacterium]